MNPYSAYQQQASSGWLRIDLLLALYDGVIGKVEAARAALGKRDVKEAKKLLESGATLMVAGLVSAVDPSRGEMAAQFLRLYEFVHYSLGVGDLPRVEASLKVLRTLREGLEEIRPEAAELERSGKIPPAGAGPGVQFVV